MTETPTLFEWTPPAHAAARHADPATSKEAAHSMTEARVTELERNVLRALGALHGGTIEQVAIYLDASLVTISPRFRPLANKGLIVDSGEKRATQSGRNAIVWRLVQ